MNTAPNIDIHPSLNLGAYRVTISYSVQWVLDLFNLPLIHMLGSAMVKNT